MTDAWTQDPIAAVLVADAERLLASPPARRADVRAAMAA
jgi:hypothetical protein